MTRPPYTKITGAIPINQKVDSNTIIQTRTYKLITPLFGGGAETQRPDAITTVRATEVRGHLRFWWRATRGGMYGGDLAKMKEAEEKIWGSAAQKGKAGYSQVKLNIVLIQKKDPVSKQEVEFYDKKTKTKKKVLVDIGDPKSTWSYVAFPLREQINKQTGKKIPAGSVLGAGIEFELELTYSKTVKDEVEPALWAWETFGGIGARTRRGFGALQCTKENGKTIMPPNRADVNESYLSKYLMTNGKWSTGVPHLKKKPKFKISKIKGTQIEVWEHIFGTLQKFRQQRYGSKHGLSQWPEANEIRRYHDINVKFPEKENEEETKGEKTDIVLVEKFPRAKFGLPIQFNMPHDENIVEKKIELHGKKLTDKKYIDRLASPLIIRPIACIDGKEESAVGIAVVLEWEKIDTNETYTPPGGLFLSSEIKGDFPVESNLEDDEVINIEPLNLSGKPQPDVLQAFLNYLK